MSKGTASPASTDVGNKAPRMVLQIPGSIKRCVTALSSLHTLLSLIWINTLEDVKTALLNFSAISILGHRHSYNFHATFLKNAIIDYSSECVCVCVCDFEIFSIYLLQYKLSGPITHLWYNLGRLN